MIEDEHQPYDKSSKWLIQHHGDSLLRLTKRPRRDELVHWVAHACTSDSPLESRTITALERPCYGGSKASQPLTAGQKAARAAAGEGRVGRRPVALAGEPCRK